MTKKNPWQTPTDRCSSCKEVVKLESSSTCAYLGFVVHKKCAVLMKERLAKLLEMNDE